jgi:hypothetical protein
MGLHLLMGADKRLGVRHMGTPAEMTASDFESLARELFGVSLS